MELPAEFGGGWLAIFVLAIAAGHDACAAGV
jgi:hypothetical protein